MSHASSLAAASVSRLSWIKHTAAGIAVALLAGCAGPERQGGSACVAPGEWHVPGEGAVDGRALIARLARESQAVLLGETHESAAHHRWQLETLRALERERPGSIMIGLEMLPRRMQPVLDRWVSGAITSADLERELDWKRHWGFDFAMFQPVFELARERRLPMIALNVDRTLVRAVSARGFTAVPLAEREGVTPPAPATPAYVERLFASFAAHARPGAPPPERNAPGFLRFVEAQQIWDRAMAQGIADSLSRAPGRLAVALAGSGHVEGGDGIAHQLADLGVRRVAGLLPWDAERDCARLVRGLAAAVYGIDAVRGSTP